MNNSISLNKNYSTTRLLVKEQPKIVNSLEDNFKTVLFLPKNKDRKGEGGLRTKGYFKKSYENKPLVSIITVVFNGEKYLEETIKSVLNQTYDNVEYIIIDGGSTDGTLDIIKKYEDKIDYWVSEKDKGIYDAMNKGIFLSLGKIIGIINADDFLYVNTLKKISKIFNNELMFTYGNLMLIDEEDKELGEIKSLGIDNIKYKLFKQMPFLHPTMFISKQVYKQIGLYDIKYRLSADYDFSLRLIANHIKFMKLDFPTGVFRIGGQSGGVKSYLENHKILLTKGINPILVYINTISLFIKLFFRKVIVKWFQ